MKIVMLLNRIVGCGGVLVVFGVLVGVCVPPATPSTTSTRPPPLPPLPLSTTAGVMTEAPPPKPSELRLRPKDCSVYVLGELRAIKKHGETWFNDGNACELCKCVQGLKRCYYHYCNLRTEVVTNLPAGRPPLDDEDGGEGEGEDQEGSGRPPPNHIKILPDVRSLDEENDTRVNAFCGPCYKKCQFGYKIDPVKQCRQCACRRRCHSLEKKCHLRCPDGLATDSHGCPVCQCRGEGHGGRRSHQNCNETSVRGCLDGSRTRQVGEEWSRSACVACRCVAAGYTECNVTQCPTPPPCTSRQHHGGNPWGGAPAQHPCCPPCKDLSADEPVHEISVGRAEVTVQSAWDKRLTYSQPRTPAPHHGATSDGTVKSAVQAVGLGWWQMLLIMVPLALVCVVGAVCALKHWRRAHRDKYDINAYRMPPPLTEKVRPVATAADHVRGRMM